MGHSSFYKNNIGVEIKDPRMYVFYNQFCTHASRGMNEIVSLALTLFLTPLGGFSPFSRWPLIFHFSSVASLLQHRHLQHVCSFPPPLLHNTRFIKVEVFVICMLPLAYSLNCSVICILPSFCEIIVMLLQALSHRAMGNNLEY